METIKNYLDNVFNRLPETDEVKNLKLDLLANMEDKYYELKQEGKSENEAIGIVISEFGNIDEIINEMDIEIKSEQNFSTINVEQAKQYITASSYYSKIVGVGVAMILFGFAVLTFLTQAIEDNKILIELSDNAKDTVPTMLLIVFAVPAVALFIYSGMKLQDYKWIETKEFSLASTARNTISRIYAKVKEKQMIALIVGVSLCIISILPVFIGDMISDSGFSYGLSITLIMIGVAVYLFITTGSVSQACKQLLQIDDFAKEKRKENNVVSAVASVVWPVAVCIFLISGLIYHKWEINWIIFPITGLLFGAFSAVYSTIQK